jgi:hypothetical protein
MKPKPGRDLILYKYYPPERISVLLDRFVYFSHPSRFNDPFELEPHLEAVHITERHLEIVAKTFQVKGQEFNTDEILATLESERERREQIDALKEHLLILSLSEEPDSLLMWAHYGVAHTGFVIGFDMSKDTFALRADGLPRALAKVRYSTHRPSAASIYEVREDELRLTKSVEWMHEKEWRMFESPFNADAESSDATKMCWPFRFDPDVIERVILGARISDDTNLKVQEILAAPEYKHVKIFQCQIDRQQFRLNLRQFEDIHS